MVGSDDQGGTVIYIVGIPASSFLLDSHSFHLLQRIKMRHVCPPDKGVADYGQKVSVDSDAIRPGIPI
jgi:hypothetical protein